MRKQPWMMGLCLLMGVMALLPVTKANAQARIGMKGGINFADLTAEARDQTNGTPDGHSLTSFHAGLIADLPLVKGLALQPGLMVSGKGAKTEYHNTVLGTYTAKINPLYLEIPVNLLFKPMIGAGTHLYIGAGPYLGFGVGGKARFSATGTPAGDAFADHNLKFGNDSGDDLKSTDIGANVLAGFEFSNGFLVGAQYGLSFTNNAPNGDNSAAKILRNKVLSVSVGYLFGP